MSDAPNRTELHSKPWGLLLVLGTSLLGIALLFLWQFVSGVANLGGGTAMVMSQYNPKEVIGDLGGMKVSIPRHVAEYVEYDGDPGWSGKRKGPEAVRTYDSRLMSFGFRVRFPDMATLSNKEMWTDYKAGIPPTTQWLKVGVTTGSIYPGDGFMDRWTRTTLERPDARYGNNRYEKLPKNEFELTTFVVPGVDPKTGKPYREHDEAEQVFVDRDASGQVLTHIECSHRGFQPCTQTWSMEYEEVHAEVYVSYTRPMLKNWREIQKKVTQFMLDFRVTNPAGGVTPPATAASAS